MDKILKQPYPAVPSTYSSTINSILQATLEKNPDTRASIDDVLCVPLVLDLVWL